MQRYAVYYAPEPGPFADAAASWLGWDPAQGVFVQQPAVGPDLADLTAEPRKYGFHATLKPPFRLIADSDRTTLHTAIAALAGRLRPIEFPALQFLAMDGFLALVPVGQTAVLTDLAAQVVANLDAFRAPLTPAEIARRRPDRLTARQSDLLGQWGYPYVMEEFRFHLTLSGNLAAANLAALRPMAEMHFAPHLPQPFRIAALCLFGQGVDGMFRLLHRYSLG